MGLRRVCDRMEVGCRRKKVRRVGTKGKVFQPNLVWGIRANILSRQRTPIGYFERTRNKPSMTMIEIDDD